MLSEAGKAREFAKSYVSLVEALLREGCSEEVARSEARMAALLQLKLLDAEPKQYDPAKGPCPSCGNG